MRCFPAWSGRGKKSRGPRAQFGGRKVQLMLAGGQAQQRGPALWKFSAKRREARYRLAGKQKGREPIPDGQHQYDAFAGLGDCLIVQLSEQVTIEGGQLPGKPTRTGEEQSQRPG